MGKKVESLKIESMNQAQSNEFMTSNIARAEADPVIAAQLAPQLEAWKAANIQFDYYLKQSQRVLLTEDIKGLDNVQDKDLTAFMGMVRALQNVPDDELHQAARRVKLCTDTYRIETDWEYIKEMNFIRQMLDDLQGRLAADVAALGLTLFVNKLAESNAAVRAAQEQRDNDAAGVLKGQTMAWRRETEKKYREFVEMLNARALVFGDADYASFIDRLNSSIAHYRQILAVAAGIRAAKKDKEGGNNEGGGSTGSHSGSSSGSGTVEPVESDGNNGSNGNNEPTNPNEPSNPDEPINPGGGDTPGGSEDSGNAGGSGGSGGGDNGGGGSTGNGQGEDE